MTQFQVFLPPVSLQPLAGSAGFPPVQFRVVAQPSSFSLRSFSQSIERPLLGPALVDLVVERASKRRKANVAEQPVEEGRDIDPEDAGDLSRAWEEEGGSPSWTTRPDISDTAIQQLGDGHDGQSRVEPDSGSVDISRSRLTRTKYYPTTTPTSSGHRRQSQRLNPAAEYTHILPLPLADDTILSLNTTISLSPSQPSQQRAKDPDIYGDTSITNFPRWVVPLSKLISLDILLSHPRTLARPRAESDPGEGKISVIVCVTATSPPVLRRKKEERARGAEGSLWVAKWDIVAPSGLGAAGGTSMSKDRAEGSGEVGCEVVLWDKCARDYGEVVRRGDVVLLEGVDFKPGTRKDKARLVLSPSNLSPRATILYRTLPRYSTGSDYVRVSPRFRSTAKVLPEDKSFRPDLRMGRSEPGVRRVAEIAKWFAEWVGGSCIA